MLSNFLFPTDEMGEKVLLLITRSHSLHMRSLTLWIYEMNAKFNYSTRSEENIMRVHVYI